MRFLLLFSFSLFSFATFAHDNPSDGIKCKGRLYELKDAEFNAIVRADEENKALIKNLENEIATLSPSEKSGLLEELQRFSQTSNERIACVLDFQPTTSNGIYKELKLVQDNLQTDYVNLRARVHNKTANAEKELAEKQRLEKMANARSLQNLEGDPTLIQPNRFYVVSDISSAQLKSVQFSPEVVEYLHQDPKGASFLKAIQKGIVGDRGETGVKRVRGSDIFEVKVVGPSQNDRLLGCYENGFLTLLRPISKRGGNKIGADKYDFLCK